MRTNVIVRYGTGRGQLNDLMHRPRRVDYGAFVELRLAMRALAGEYIEGLISNQRLAPMTGVTRLAARFAAARFARRATLGSGPGRIGRRWL